MWEDLWEGQREETQCWCGLPGVEPWKWLNGGEGGIRTRGGFYPSHAFQACDLNRSSTSPERESLAYRADVPGAFINAIAVPISAETSVMLPGTIIVLFFWASWA